MKVNKWKWFAIGAILIALFLLGRSCGIKSVTKVSKIDTLYKVKIDSFIVPIQLPAEVIPAKTVFKWLHDTLYMPGDNEVVYLPEITPDWQLQWMNDYRSKKIYDTTIKNVRIIDTITENRLAGRKVIITNTETIIKENTIIYPPKKTIGYFSFSVDRYQVGAGIGLKTKKDWLINLELKSKHMNPELTIMVPIKLKK